MSDFAFRTSICSVIFVDIVDYSKAAVDRQVSMKAVLNDAILAGLANAPEDERIVLDSGDGAAICFFGDPEDALFAATSITGELRGKLRLRTGINLGPVKIVTDLNGNRNVIGDAINVAQRIMSFAGEDELLISRPYFEVVSCLRDDNTFAFQPLGTRKDKHIREHEVYSVAPKEGPSLRLEEPVDADASDILPPPLLEGQTQLSDAFVEKCRVHLSKSVGPLSGLLVKKAREGALSEEKFVKGLADKIASPQERHAFLAAVNSVVVVPEAEIFELHQREDGEPQHVDVQHGAVDEAVKKRATQLLALTMGPIASSVVNRAAKNADNVETFIAQVSGQIADTPERDGFIDAMKQRKS